MIACRREITGNHRALLCYECCTKVLDPHLTGACFSHKLTVQLSVGAGSFVVSLRALLLTKIP